MSDDLAQVDAIVARARAAQKRYEAGATQERYDRAAQAVAWAIMEPSRNRAIAELSVKTTGLGNVADKITKNHRKTLGLMRDIADAKTCGITPANNIINALKGGNAIVLSPSPKGVPSCEMLLEYIYEQFDKIGADRDLVLMVPAPGSKDKTQRMLETTDLVVVTGSQNNVRRAYTCGTPAIGVGAGNVTVIVDETADLADAAAKITASKTFDNATSCSSENALVVVDAIYDAFVVAMAAEGGALVTDEARIVKALWPDGHLNRQVIAQDAEPMLEALGFAGEVAEGTKFLAVETSGIGPEHKLSGEKLSRVVALYRAGDFEDAKGVASRILDHQGAGHSVGLHSSVPERALELGQAIPTCRVIVNQAHCFATGGAFNNGLPFSLSMGCGSWGGNSIDENLNWTHFIQTTKIVREIPAREPSMDEVFGTYWAEAGK